MSVEMRRGEERGVILREDCVLVRFRCDPEANDVVVPHLGDRIERIRSWVAKEDEGLPADLIDGVGTGLVTHRRERHRFRELVNVFDTRTPAARAHATT